MLSAGERQRLSIAGYDNEVDTVERLQAEIEHLAEDVKVLARATTALDDRRRRTEAYDAKRIDDLESELRQRIDRLESEAKTRTASKRKRTSR